MAFKFQIGETVVLTEDYWTPKYVAGVSGRVKTRHLDDTTTVRFYGDRPDMFYRIKNDILMRGTELPHKEFSANIMDLYGG